jgi:hypothetical protein
MGMQKMALALIVLGTVVASVGGARLPEADWWVSGLGLLVLVAGGVVLRLSTRRVEASAGISGEQVVAALRGLPDELEAICAEVEQLQLAEVTERLSGLEVKYFRPIADGAPLLLGAMGAGRFAEVFGVYASGERLVARAWSAAADHHRPEATAALRSGSARIREAALAMGRGVAR